MQVNWHQSPKDKNIQPTRIPQFEVSGQQTDHQNYDAAMKLVVSRSTIVFLILFALSSPWLVKKGMRQTKSSFAQFASNDKNLPKHKIQLQLHSIKRQKEVEGLIFDTEAKSGFAFYLVEVTVKNNGKRDFPLSIYSIKLTTVEEHAHSADLQTRSISNRLKSGTLKPGKSQRGFLVYEIPSYQQANGLDIRGGEGSLSRVKL